MKNLWFWVSQILGGVGVFVVGMAIAVLWTLALLLFVAIAALFSLCCVVYVSASVFCGSLRIDEAIALVKEASAPGPVYERK